MELRCLGPDDSAAFIDFYADFLAKDPDNADFYRPGFDHYTAYLERLNKDQAGLDLAVYQVACTHFWLCDDDATLIAALRIRHQLSTPQAQTIGHIGYDVAPRFRRQGMGTLALQLALPKARELGVEQALIVADQDNDASRRIIERNGGRLEAVVYSEFFKAPLARYWLPTEPQ